MALVRKELIRPDRRRDDGAETYRFRHLLIRDAAYDALSKGERAVLHERFADWLTEVANDLHYANGITFGRDGSGLARVAPMADVRLSPEGTPLSKGNREVRKPKTAKPKVIVAAPPTLSQTLAPRKK